MNFTFTKGFSQPVYVATLVPASERQNMLGKVEEYLRNSMTMDVKIDEDLGIKIYLEKQ